MYKLQIRLCMVLLLQLYQTLATPWTVAHQAPLSMGFSRKKYWSGLPCPPLGDLPNQGIKLCLLHLLHWQAGSLSLPSPGKYTELDSKQLKVSILFVMYTLFFLLLYFLHKDNCFTEFSCFLSNLNMNQP